MLAINEIISPLLFSILNSLTRIYICTFFVFRYITAYLLEVKKCSYKSGHCLVSFTHIRCKIYVHILQMRIFSFFSSLCRKL